LARLLDPSRATPSTSLCLFCFAVPDQNGISYKATLDPGVALPAAQDTGAYRKVGEAAGPTSSQAAYTPTLDPGKNAPVF